MENSELIKLALEARKMSYCPYSGYAVGAALLCKDGKVYTGCNIENAAFTPGNCAERTAVFKAVSEGETAFFKIAVTGGKKGESPKDFAFPCGVCRQVMQEFCNPSEFTVLVALNEEVYKEYTLKELLPDGFGPDNL